jgi:hypothetical protein
MQAVFFSLLTLLLSFSLQAFDIGPTPHHNYVDKPPNLEETEEEAVFLAEDDIKTNHHFTPVD